MAVAPLAHSSPALGAEETAAVAAVLASGQVARGREVQAFEAELSAATGAAHVVCTASGTDALVLALAAVGVGSGDEVVLPTYVCRSVEDAVRRVGATPVLCDIGEHWVMTPASVSAVCTARTRAIIAVHCFGMACDVAALAALGPAVVEDSCQAFGLSAHPAAAVQVYSFHATKCLTTGEGGAAAAHAPAMADRLRSVAAGPVAAPRLSDVQAAMGRVQLRRYPALLARRRAIAARYDDALPSAFTARRRAAAAGAHVPFRYPLWQDARAEFVAVRAAYAARGVAVRQGVDALLHRARGLPDAAFPQAVAAYTHTVSVPLWPAMDDTDASRVIAAVQAFAGDVHVA